MKLYDYDLSGNCYKLRLFMSMLDIKWETQTIDFYPGLEHKSASFLALNLSCAESAWAIARS